MDNSVLIFKLNSLSGSCEERGGTSQLVLLQCALVRNEQDVAPCTKINIVGWEVFFKVEEALVRSNQRFLFTLYVRCSLLLSE